MCSLILLNQPGLDYMAYYIGIDLGGTNLKAGLVDTETGEVSNLLLIPTLAHEGYESVINRMANLAKRVVEESTISQKDIKGIGVGVPGVLDLDKGLTLFLPNLPGTWPKVPLRAMLSKRSGLPVVILNDARSITYGEWRFGAGRGVDTIACYAIGTGVGGGLVINGQLHLGIGGTGGELGHQIIDFNGPQCGCGSRGCLEAYASGPAIAAMGIKAVIQGRTTIIGELADYDLNKINAKLIAKAANKGDIVAKEIYEEVGFYIGIAVANTCVSIGPQRVIITGGVARAGDLLFSPIRRTVRERVKVMPVDQVEIVASGLGNNAGIIGVASWADVQT